MYKKNNKSPFFSCQGVRYEIRSCHSFLCLAFFILWEKGGIRALIHFFLSFLRLIPRIGALELVKLFVLYFASFSIQQRSQVSVMKGVKVSIVPRATRLPTSLLQSESTFTQLARYMNALTRSTLSPLIFISKSDPLRISI